VIDAELNMEDHGSIPTTMIGRGLKSFMPELILEQIKLVVKKK
jgi:hypothetical protein